MKNGFLVLLLIPPPLYFKKQAEYLRLSCFSKATRRRKVILKNVPAEQQVDEVSQTMQNHSLILKYTCKPNLNHSIDQQL